MDEDTVCPFCLDTGETFIIVDDEEGDGHWIPCYHQEFNLLEVGNNE